MTADSEAALVPPDARRVARRAMVLSAIVCRCNSDHPDAIDLWKRLKKWVEQLFLEDEMESTEKTIFYAPLGTLDDRQRIRGTWNAEGLGILAWALKLFLFPRVGAKVDPYELTDSFCFLNDEAADVISSAQLRSRAELDSCRELMYAIHCRLREYLRTHTSKSIAHWIEPSWLSTLGLDSPLGPHHDLRIGEVEIGLSNENAVRQCEWTVCERHRASIWLVGEEGPEYSLFPVDS